MTDFAAGTGGDIWDFDSGTSVTTAAVAASSVTVIDGAAGAATNAYILQNAAAQIDGLLTETANGGAVEIAILAANLTTTVGTSTNQFYTVMDNGSDTGIYRVTITQGAPGLIDQYSEIAAVLVGSSTGDVTTDFVAANFT